MKRFWIYQRERFPLITHGIVIAAFSASAIAFSAFARHTALPPWWILAGGFVSSLIFFAQMRVADEWKDAEDDAKFRPYRPVPRGLVTLRELAAIAALGGAVQLAVALAVSPRLVPVLLGVWIYFALMSREFFIGKWLRTHPAAYIATHMAIVPMIDFYVSSFDWLRAHAHAPSALAWFLAVTFCNGLVVEIGRKIRAPQDEERGVETYSALWGRTRAALIWCTACAVTASLAVAAASHVAFARVDAPIFAAALTAAIAAGALFIRRPVHRTATAIEAFSGVWTVTLYVCLGLVPFAYGGAL
jgi:4-hydroxybenzoate polyprenyltransferase